MALLTAVRQLKRTERPGGSVSGQQFVPLSQNRFTAVLTFLRDAGLWAAGLRGCEMRRSWPPGDLAIVTLLSQLAFASDVPIDGRFRARNTPGKDVACVS